MTQKGTSIVLIDDDLAMNYLHKRLFLKLQFGETLVPFYNCNDALKELKKLNSLFIDSSLLVIFLDINMPGMDGWSFLEVFETIQSTLKYNVKIFILSSSINPEDIIKAKQNNFVTDYLIKPLNQEGVNSIIEKYLQ
ncbi:MAG: response regulator [Flavobacterium sp.]